MEQLLITIFSEKGIIYWLFVSIILLALFKWIPHAVSKFEAIVTKFSDMTERQHTVYEATLKQISWTFLEQMQASNEWHRSHAESLQKQNDKLERIERNIDIIVKK